MFMTGRGGRTEWRPGGMIAHSAVAFDVTRGDGSSKGWSARVARIVKVSRVKPGARSSIRASCCASNKGAMRSLANIGGEHPVATAKPTVIVSCDVCGLIAQRDDGLIRSAQ
jgi:hypothetical protein